MKLEIDHLKKNKSFDRSKTSRESSLNQKPFRKLKIRRMTSEANCAHSIALLKNPALF